MSAILQKTLSVSFLLRNKFPNKGTVFVIAGRMQMFLFQCWIPWVNWNLVSCTETFSGSEPLINVRE